MPPPPSLCHSLNSRGELGMFVDPYSCSCATCVDYVAERAAPAAAAEPAMLPCQSCRDRIREVSPDTPEGCVPLCREGPHCSPLLCDSCRSACGDPYMAPELRSAAPELSLAPSSEGVIAWQGPAALGRAPANHLWTGSDWVHQDSPYARSPSSVASGLFPVPPERMNPSALLPQRSLGGGIGLTRSLTLGMGAGCALAPSASGYVGPTPTPASLSNVGLSNAAPAIAESDNESDDESDDEDDGAAAARPALPGLGPCSPEEESLLVRLSHLRLSYKERQDEVYSEAYRSHDEAAAQDWEWEDLDRKIDAIEELLRSFGVAIRDA